MPSEPIPDSVGKLGIVGKSLIFPTVQLQSVLLNSKPFLLSIIMEQRKWTLVLASPTLRHCVPLVAKRGPSRFCCPPSCRISSQRRDVQRLQDEL